ncbi:hypothetical protein VTO73DRAFT_3272 [Trametes versicolor]
MTCSTRQQSRPRCGGSVCAHIKAAVLSTNPHHHGIQSPSRPRRHGHRLPAVRLLRSALSIMPTRATVKTHPESRAGSSLSEPNAHRGNVARIAGL